MRWCVVYHPGLQARAVIAETALDNHRARGWRRVSDWAIDQTVLNPAQFDIDVDLDEPDPKGKTSKKSAAAAADSDKEQQS